MSKYPLGGRPSKAALSKIKTGTIVVSIATFLGSLAGVAYFNPGVGNSAAVTSQASNSTTSIAMAPQSSNTTRQLASQQQSVTFPTVRTRGS